MGAADFKSVGKVSVCYKVVSQSQVRFNRQNLQCGAHVLHVGGGGGGVCACVYLQIAGQFDPCGGAARYWRIGDAHILAKYGCGGEFH